MSIKNAVIAVAFVAVAGQVVADVPDGKGGRTSPQASPQQITTSSVRKCCENTVAGNCQELIVASAGSIEPRVPPQRTEIISTPLRCKHMPTATGAIETRVPPQRAATTPAPAAHRACCENVRCTSHVS
jgi:hypothetical protein